MRADGDSAKPARSQEAIVTPSIQGREAVEPMARRSSTLPPRIDTGTVPKFPAINNESAAEVGNDSNNLASGSNSRIPHEAGREPTRGRAECGDAAFNEARGHSGEEEPIIAQNDQFDFMDDIVDGSTSVFGFILYPRTDHAD